MERCIDEFTEIEKDIIKRERTERKRIEEIERKKIEQYNKDVKIYRDDSDSDNSFDYVTYLNNMNNIY